MPDAMFVEVLTPDKTLYSGEAAVITLPGVAGSFQLLNMHAPMIANLKVGTIEITGLDNQKETYSVNNGLVEVLNNRVVVLI